MIDYKIIPCEACGGYGGWSVESTFNPFTGRIGYQDIECRECDGTGEVVIECDEEEQL